MFSLNPLKMFREAKEWRNFRQSISIFESYFPEASGVKIRIQDGYCRCEQREVIAELQWPEQINPLTVNDRLDRSERFYDELYERYGCELPLNATYRDC